MIAATLAHLAQAAPPPVGPDAPIPTPTLVFQPIAPEILLCVAAIVGMLYEAFARRSSRGVHLAFALIGLVGAGVAAIRLWDEAIASNSRDPRWLNSGRTSPGAFDG